MIYRLWSESKGRNQPKDSKTQDEKPAKSTLVRPYTFAHANFKIESEIEKMKIIIKTIIIRPIILNNSINNGN